MSSRESRARKLARKARNAAKARDPSRPEPPSSYPLARWLTFVGRGHRIEFVPLGIVVNATTPEEMVLATSAEIVRRTKNAGEN